MEPKIFISYSWSSSVHRERVRQIADRLIGDGIDVIIDIYDLKEGNDKNAFMEKLVVDNSITKVLVMCDKTYAEKANQKIRGVGTESQIISQQVYTKVEQTKFIPILCDNDENGEPYLPVFMSSLIGIDFSTPEKENENWDQLVRLLHGQPLHKKPKLGPRPSYLNETQYESTSEPQTKFNALRQALLQNKKGVAHYRSDFLESAFSYLDSLRVRAEPESTSYEFLALKIVQDSSAMRPIRNLYCDWLLLEIEFTDANELADVLTSFYETLLILPTLPAELRSFQMNWFDAQSIFIYEVFLYSIALMIKKGAFKLINEVFTSHFLVQENEFSRHKNFVSYDHFFTSSNTIQHALSQENRYHNPVAEFIKRNADRNDVTFSDIIEADLLCFAHSCTNENINWYAAFIGYAGYYATSEIFLRATQHKGFMRLKDALGVESAHAFRAIMQKYQDSDNNIGYANGRGGFNYVKLMNLDNLDTLK
ncbi:toll/interleukin-1 receptor domain-containing protein [Enterobacter sp.]|uniref:toll/interleukin-1 receptor domain-containing protein n=1 Tax=Enterobacter sp. TaxID=42895 RepID=UPI00296FF9AC|nr:toll/interleukin-1 receptor domain-containing protein [Enterobacter sp.]